MDIAKRRYYQEQLNSIRPYLLSAFYLRGITECEKCNKPLLSMTNRGMTWTKDTTIDHKKYDDDITLSDLSLLCYDCHKSHTMMANDLQLSGGYCPHCQRPY